MHQVSRRLAISTTIWRQIVVLNMCTHMASGSRFFYVCGIIQQGCLVNQQMLFNVSHVSGNKSNAADFKAKAINVVSLH